MNRLIALGVLVSTGFCGCDCRSSEVRPPGTLAKARAGFETKLLRRTANEEAMETPPHTFEIVKYPSAVGDLGAYVTSDPEDGKKHPAIVWITGGDCNSVGNVWDPRPPDNDQAASAYRHAGIVMMFPALRGGSGNPGVREGYWGEVDDVIAAGAHLAKLSYVDPERVYLGGHSTGGTLALLVAEYSSQFRGTFSFGPVTDPTGYDNEEWTPFDTSDKLEVQLRSPIHWLDSVTQPTFVIEGSNGNEGELLQLREQTSNQNIRFLRVVGADHFDVLDATNRLIAKRILMDVGPTSNLEFTVEELSAPFTN